jgi:uncharacterized membrane protein HdeD (DUF308 family)
MTRFTSTSKKSYAIWARGLYALQMSDTTQRSELNYLIAGALLFFGGGYLIKFGQDDGGSLPVIVGAVLLLVGIALIVRGVTRGRR